MSDIIRRLKRLENTSPNNLVIVVLDNGIEKKCSIKELEKNPHYVFVRVQSGNNLKDLDELLFHFDTVQQQVNNSEAIFIKIKKNGE